MQNTNNTDSTAAIAWWQRVRVTDPRLDVPMGALQGQHRGTHQALQPIHDEPLAFDPFGVAELRPERYEVTPQAVAWSSVSHILDQIYDLRGESGGFALVVIAERYALRHASGQIILMLPDAAAVDRCKRDTGRDLEA